MGCFPFSSHLSRLQKRVARRFFSSLSDLYHYYDLYSTSKYVTPYDRGIVIINLVLSRAGNKRDISSVASVLPQLLRDISLLFPIPDSPLHRLFRESKLSIQEVVFSYCGGVFAQHFFNRLGTEYEALKSFLDPADVNQMSVLENLRQKLRASTMREKHVWDVLLQHPHVLKARASLRVLPSSHLWPHRSSTSSSASTIWPRSRRSPFPRSRARSSRPASRATRSTSCWWTSYPCPRSSPSSSASCSLPTASSS